MLDNKTHGNVGDELKSYLQKGSKLSIMSSYFTIYAFESLKKELLKVDEVRFLFNNPTFIQDFKIPDPLVMQEKIKREKSLSGTDLEVKFRNELNQAKIARECADWIRSKVDMKSLKLPMAQGNLIHVQNKNDDSIAIQGTSHFTSSGLGYTYSSNYEMNSLIKEPGQAMNYINWFDLIWNNEEQVESVKQEVLSHIEKIYRDNTPEFLYYVTLYNIFKDFLEELSEDDIVKSKTGFKDTVIWNKLYKFQKRRGIRSH